MGGQFVVNLIAASLYKSMLHNPSKVSSIAPAALTMLFFFNLIYAAWGIVSFLIPTEILSLGDSRSRESFRYYRMGYRSWLDHPGKPHHARQH
jgi:hypothetical protein